MRRANGATAVLLRDVDLPPSVRLSGPDRPAKVMRAHWADPDDVRPSARKTVREVSGFRCYCPLRRILRASNGNQVTVQHVIAADRLRLLVDLARLGYSAMRDYGAAIAAIYGPSQGPAHGAVLQSKAARDVTRAMGIYTPGQQRLLRVVVLENVSLARWAKAETERLSIPHDTRVEQGKLIAVLDLLAEHFRAEVDKILRQGAAGMLPN